MAATADDAGGSAEAPSPSAPPSAAAPNVAELVMLMKVRERCIKGKKKIAGRVRLKGRKGCPQFRTASFDLF